MFYLTPKLKDQTRMSIKSNLYCLLIILSVFSYRCHSDGLTDLNTALSNLDGNSAISATLHSSFTEKRGRKQKTKITTAFADIQVHDDLNGLQITYTNEILHQIKVEENEKERNEETNTPTLNAINNIKASELRNMLSAAPKLMRSLIKAEFLKEEAMVYQEKDARILHFNLPLEAIIKDKDVRSYVDDFEGKYQIIIGSDGVPLQVKLTFEGSGSAYIFFKLSIKQSRTYFYKVIDDRLVNFRNEFTRHQKSTWDKRESSGFNELTLAE
jgi:hypothetical protein